MKKFCCLLFLLSAFPCYSQPNELHFNRLSIKDGLPESVITMTLQDKEGYMWIGTQAGLVRYDGYTTRVYQFGIEDPLDATIAKDKTFNAEIKTDFDESIEKINICERRRRNGVYDRIMRIIWNRIKLKVKSNIA